MRKWSEISTPILAEQPKAMTNHKSLKSLTKYCAILCDLMGTVGKICVLVKYSTKQEKMLESIVENMEGEVEESSRSNGQNFNKLCLTRWTIKAKCFKKILKSYEVLSELWGQSLKMQIRIEGSKRQMSLFKIYFGQNLSQRLYVIMDNLSKTLQQKKMYGPRGMEIADLFSNIEKHLEWAWFYFAI